MKNLILTLDYELYGNGSGNVFKHIIEPTEKILRIVDKYNAKITIFFEVVEYWRLKSEWELGNKMGYDKSPAKSMEKQLIQPYKNGHDIQLHIHPQWINAHWTGTDWVVDLSQWRLGSYKKSGGLSLTALLKKGKETLESIINDRNYHCHTIRAGGYNIQPSYDLVKAMQESGLKIDSSVYPGGKEMGRLSQYDYTGIPVDRGWWFCGDCLESESDKTKALLELPIVAFPFTRIKKYLALDRVKSILNNRQSAKDSFDAKTSDSNGGFINKVQYFFQQESLTWDYCLFTIAMHRKFLKHIAEQSERDVFVLVGHPKSFVSEKGLVYLLTHTDNYSKISIDHYFKSHFSQVN